MSCRLQMCIRDRHEKDLKQFYAARRKLTGEFPDGKVDMKKLTEEYGRAVWQAELDAIFAHLYGLTTEDLRYILDPEDVFGKGCINETLRVLKERPHRELHSEYKSGISSFNDNILLSTISSSTTNPSISAS